MIEKNLNARGSRNNYISLETNYSMIKQDILKSRRRNYMKEFITVKEPKINKTYSNIDKDKRIRDLECYVELLEEKILVLKYDNEKLISKQSWAEINAKLSEAAIAYEEMLNTYSQLSKEFIKLKTKEYETFEKYVAACEEKEKVIVETELESSKLRMKIKIGRAHV